MTTSLIREAAETVARPDVQSLIRELSAHGLAVCVPHMHDSVTGEFQPLPKNMVQSESHLQVSFVDRDSITENDIPVAWRWDNTLQVVQTCQVCRPDGPHH